MWRCLEADLEILVHHGHLYVPLLVDPEIHRESQVRHIPVYGAATELENYPPSPRPSIYAVQGRLFVQAVSAASLVDQYARIFPGDYDERRRLLQEQYCLTADLWDVALDPKLATIIFHILPHFLRRAGLGRRRLGEGEILDLLGERLRVPARFFDQARAWLDVKPLKTALERLESAKLESGPPPEGLVLAAALRAWWQEALQARLLAEARADLLRGLRDREHWAQAQESRLAILMYLADKGALETGRLRLHPP